MVKKQRGASSSDGGHVVKTTVIRAGISNETLMMKVISDARNEASALYNYADPDGQNADPERVKEAGRGGLRFVAILTFLNIEAAQLAFPTYCTSFYRGHPT